MTEAAKTSAEPVIVAGSTTSPRGFQRQWLGTRAGKGEGARRRRGGAGEGAGVEGERPGERVRQEVDSRSTPGWHAASGNGVCDASHPRAAAARGQRGSCQGEWTFIAERTEQLGSYLTDANEDQVLRDVEAFARRQPWLVALAERQPDLERLRSFGRRAAPVTTPARPGARLGDLAAASVGGRATPQSGRAPPDRRWLSADPSRGTGADSTAGKHGVASREKETDDLSIPGTGAPAGGRDKAPRSSARSSISRGPKPLEPPRPWSRQASRSCSSRRPR